MANSRNPKARNPKFRNRSGRNASERIAGDKRAAGDSSASAARNQNSGASLSSQRIGDRFRSYMAHHRRVAVESLQGLLNNWLSSLMTWLVIGIALALPAILLVMLNNLASLSGEWDGNPRISVYLSQEADEQTSKALLKSISSWKGVASTVYIGPGEALKEFQSFSGFGEAVLALDKNPLPAVILVTLGEAQEAQEAQIVQINLLLGRLESLPQVDSVSVDLEWIQRLQTIISLGQRLVTSVGAFLALGVLLIVGNTIRLAIENRRSEIEVVKLVGGTDAFVRRPFLYLGFWYGAGGVFIAWLLLGLSLLYIDTPVKRLAGAYDTSFALEGLNLEQTGIFLGLGVVLGVFGAWIAVNRHLKDIEPQ